MRSRRGLPFTLRRMGMHRPVLAAAALLTLITAALIATLAAFAGQALSQAVQRKLAAAPGTSVVISGSAQPARAAAATAAIRSTLGSDLGAKGYTLTRGTWSDPLRLPARYDGANVPLAQAAALQGVAGHAVLLSGRWPGPPQPGQPISTALPQTVAALLHLAPGDSLSLRDQVSGQQVRVTVTGIFRPRDSAGAAAAYWGLNIIAASGASTGGGFTTYGPLIVSPAVMGTAALPASEASWVAEPVASGIQAGAVAGLAARLTTGVAYLRNSSTMAGLQVTTGLPALLSGIASNLVVSRSVLAIGTVQLLLLAAIALAGTATLLATGRENESALLSARGGSRWQQARLSLTEAALLTVAAVVIGGLAGGKLAGLLARTGSLRSAGLRLPVISWEAIAAIALTAVFATLIMAGPALRTLSPGAARVRRGRQAAVAVWVRSGADLVLVALAGLAGWQLRRSQIVAPSASGAIGIDPVLALAPALALAGGTVLLLRLLPVAARMGDRLASRGNRLVLSLASWEVSRHPLRQASVALLVVMAVATGTLALSEHQSWVRSTHDQAAFAAGADVRVDTPGAIGPGQAAAVDHAPGVRHAMAAAPITSGSTDEILAVGADQAAGTVLLRSDESKLPARALFASITPAAAQPGITLPGHPTSLSLTLSLGPASLRMAPVTVLVSVQDASGNVYQLPAGTLTADGRPHTLSTALGGRAAYPLRVVAVMVNYQLLPARSRRDAVFSVLGAGSAKTGAQLGTWTPSVSSAQLTALQASFGAVVGPAGPPSFTSSRAIAGGAQALSFDPGYGLATASIGVSGRPSGPPGSIGGLLTLTAMPPQRAPVPAIATHAFLSAHDIGVGSTDVVSIPGLSLPVKIVAQVSTFPTISSGTGGVIVDLAAIQDDLVSKQLPPVPVTEWWLATAHTGVPPGLARYLPGGSAVTTTAALGAGLIGDPLSAVPQQALLAIAIAVALLAMAGFFVSIAANVTQRRPRTALLAALGVTRRARALQLCLEELMISLPSAVAGLVLGGLISGLLVPSITLTADASKPVPPVLTQFAWPLVVPLALAVALLPVLVAAATAVRRPDPAATLRTTELV